MALLTTKEEQIEEKVLTTAKSAGTDITALGEQVAIKKLWLVCRGRLNKSTTGSVGSETIEDQIPPDVAIGIKGHWKEVHGFVLPDSWILATACQKKMLTDATLQPPQVTVLLMEQLRLLSSLVRSTGTFISVVPGRRNVEASESITDALSDNTEVYL